MRARISPKAGRTLHEAGALLLFLILAWAAVAKIADPLPLTKFLGSLVHLPLPWLAVAIGAVEDVIALWLISGFHRRFALTAALCLFVGFATTQVYWSAMPGAMGGCGCLGSFADGNALDRWMPAALAAFGTLLGATLLVSDPEASLTGGVR